MALNPTASIYDNSSVPQGQIATWDEVQSTIAAEGTDPDEAADAIKQWHEVARQQLEAAADRTPEQKWADTTELDKRVAEGLASQQERALSAWVASSFASQEELAQYSKAFDDAGGNLDAVPEQFRARADEHTKIASLDLWRIPDDNRFQTGSIMAGDTKLGAYKTREANGETDVLIDVAPQNVPLEAEARAAALEADADKHDKGMETDANPLNQKYKGTALGVRQEMMRADAAAIRAQGDRPLNLKVATPTDEDVKAEAARLEAEAKRNEEESLAIAMNPENTASTEQFDAKARALREQAKAMTGPDGKRILTDARIAEAVKAPEFQERLGKWGLDEDFTAALMGSTIRSAQLVQSLKGAEGDYLGRVGRGLGKALAFPGEALSGKPIESLDIVGAEEGLLSAYPGTTFTDDSRAVRLAVGAAGMAGDMGPYLLGGGLANKALTGIVDGALGKAALATAEGTFTRGIVERAVKTAAASLGKSSAKGGIGAGAVALGMGAAGGSLAETNLRIKQAEEAAAMMEQQAKELEAKGDAAGAKDKRALAGDKMAEVERIKSGQTMQAAGTGVLMAVGGHIIPGGSSKAASWYGRFLGGVAKSGSVMAGITGVQEQFVNRITDPEASASLTSLGDSFLLGAFMGLPGATMDAFTNAAARHAERLGATLDAVEANRQEALGLAERTGSNDAETTSLVNSIIDGQGDHAVTLRLQEMEAERAAIEQGHNDVMAHAERTAALEAATTPEAIEAAVSGDVLPAEATREQKQLKSLRELQAERMLLNQDAVNLFNDRTLDAEQKAKKREQLDAKIKAADERIAAAKEKVPGPTGELLRASEAPKGETIAGKDQNKPTKGGDDALGSNAPAAQASEPTGAAQSNADTFESTDASVVAPPSSIDPVAAVEARESPAQKPTKPRSAPSHPNNVPDIIEWISDEMGIRPGKAGEMDGLANVSPYWKKFLLGRNGGGSEHSTVAQAAFESGKFGMRDGTPQALNDAINAAIEGRVKARKQNAVSGKIERAEEQQNRAFERDRSTGDIPVDASKLSEGDQILLNGEIMTVTGRREANPEDMGDNGSVELTGGTQYGKRTMQLDKGTTLMMVDGFKRDVPFGNENPMSGDLPNGRSIKNEAINQVRRELGDEPLTSGKAQPWEPLWEEAGRVLEADPSAGLNLVQKLIANPDTAHTPLEAEILLRHGMGTENAMKDAGRRAARASLPEAEREKALLDYQTWRENLIQYQMASRVSGAAAGRSLAIRKHIKSINDVPSSEQMIADKMIVEGGRDLTKEERHHQERMHKRMQDAQDAVEAAERDLRAKAETYARDSMIQTVMDEIAKDVGEAAPKPPGRKVRDALKKRSDDAKAELERRRNDRPKPMTNVGSTGGDIAEGVANFAKDLPLYADIAASLLAETVGKVKDYGQRKAEVVAKMAKDFQELTAAQIREIMGAAEKVNVALDEQLKALAGKRSKASPLKPSEVVAKQRAKANGAPLEGDALSGKVARELMKAHIIEGVQNVGELMAKTKASLQEVYTDVNVSDRAVLEAVTGYGHPTMPNSDPVAKSMTDYTRQMLLIRKLDAAKAGEAVLRAGKQRDKASETVRKLQRELNEHMRRSGYTASGPDQIKGRSDAIKTQLRNQIEDLDAIINNGETPKAKGMRVPTDAETLDLRARRDALQETVDGMPEHAAAREEAALMKAVDAAKASRDEFTKRLAEKRFETAKKPSPKASAELKAMEAERDLAEELFLDAKSEHKKAQAATPEGKAAKLEADLKKATAAVEAKEDELRAQETKKNLPEKSLSNDPALRLLQERQIELNKALARQRYGDGMDALEEWAKNRKRDLQDRLDGKTKAKDEKRAKPTGQEADAIRKEIKDLEKAVKDKESPAKALKSIQKRVVDLQKRIDAKDLASRKKSENPDTPEYKAEKEALDKLKEIYKSMVEADPTRLNETFRKRVAADMARMEKSRASGFAKVERKQPIQMNDPRLDEASRKAQRERADAKLEYERDKERDRRAKLHWVEQKMLRLNRVATIALIAGFKIMGKLGVMAGGRLVMSPIRQAISATIAHTPGFRAVGEMSPRHSQFSFSIEAASFWKGLMSWKNESKEVLKTGKTFEEATLDESAAHDLDPSVLDYIGNSHAVMKLPAFRQEFEKSLAYRKRGARKKGEDPDHPLTALRLQNEALLDARRAKLQQDNMLSNAWKNALKSMADNKLHPTTGKAASMLLSFNTPIVRIPSNYFAESASHVGVGLVYGLAKALHVNVRGLEKLTSGEADSILRHLTNGTVGGALGLLGFYAFQYGAASGFYVQGVHKEDKDGEESAPEHQFKVGGTVIPKLATHTPALEAIHFGATVAKVMDHVVKKTGKHETMSKGILAATAGMLEELPYVRGNPIKLFDPGHEGTYARNSMASRPIPNFVREIADWTDWDVDANGEKVKRRPEGLIESFMVGIPWLRKKVPTQQERDAEEFSRANAKRALKGQAPLTR